MTKEEKEVMRMALSAMKELVAQTETRFFTMKHDHPAFQNARGSIAEMTRCLANDALEKKAENARELGLDYD